MVHVTRIMCTQVIHYYFYGMTMQDLELEINLKETNLLQYLQAKQLSHICSDREISKVTTDLKILYNQLDKTSHEQNKESVQQVSSNKWPTEEGMLCNICQYSYSK